MKEIKRELREMDATWLRRGKYELLAGLFMALGFVPFLPMDINLMGIILTSFVLGVIGVFGLIVTYAARKGGAIKSGTAWIFGIVAGVLLIVGLVTYPGIPTGPGAPPPGTVGGIQLGMQINPSVDTTASLPAGSYTACTSLSLLTNTGASVASKGQVWAALSAGVGAVYNQGPGNTGTFVMQTGAQLGSNQMLKATCFQLKFVLQYTGVPTATGGGAIGLPIYVYLNSITESSSGLNTNPLILQYNNGSVVNVPVFPSTVGLADFPVLLKDGGANWQPLCQNYRATNFQTITGVLSGGCSGFDANLARSTGAITFTLDVIMNLAGPFGWTTTAGSGDSPIGSSYTMTFSMGLPQSLTNPQIYNVYTPTLAQYSLQITRTTS